MVKITSNVYLKYSFVREVKVKKYITNRSYVVCTKQGQLVQKGFVNLQKKPNFQHVVLFLLLILSWEENASN